MLVNRMREARALAILDITTRLSTSCSGLRMQPSRDYEFTEVRHAYNNVSGLYTINFILANDIDESYELIGIELDIDVSFRQDELKLKTLYYV